jgi:curved DNA-binding protein CbpA
MNYYEILEVSQNASPEVIKAAYKSLIQRYHPDRNPGNAEIAGYASLVVQAYDILSDSNTRAAYDIKLKQALAEHLSIIRNKSWDDINPSDLVVKDKESYAYIWLLIAVILLSGWFILSPSKKTQSPEPVLKAINLPSENSQLTQDQEQAKFKRNNEILSEQPELVKKEANGKTKDLNARTVPIFISNLNVKLKALEILTEDAGKALQNSGKPAEKTDDLSGDTGHVLFIPMLGVIVGTVDSDSVIRHLKNKNELISQKLAEKLAYAKYEKLINIDGELYLKKIILDSIADTTGTDKIEGYPSVDEGTHGYYGIVDVLLPESYAVH